MFSVILTESDKPTGRAGTRAVVLSVIVAESDTLTYSSGNRTLTLSVTVIESDVLMSFDCTAEIDSVTVIESEVLTCGAERATTVFSVTVTFSTAQIAVGGSVNIQPELLLTFVEPAPAYHEAPPVAVESCRLM